MLDKSKEEWNREEICAVCGFSIEWFRQLRKAGKIPPPDDTKRTPYIWKLCNILPFIEKWLESKSTTKAESQPPQP